MLTETLFLTKFWASSYSLQVNDEDFDLTLETRLLLFQTVYLDQQSLDLLLLLL
jgi:hypothetical protein